MADASYNTSTDSQFPVGTAPVADALRTTGLTTRSKTRVLGVDPADTSQAAWLTTTTFYDARARPVQVQTTNARKGLDLLTTQLDFTGQVVQSVAVHQGPNHAPLRVAEFFTYDHAGRLLRTRQQLPGEARAVRIDSVAYNEIGQATQKTMGTGRLQQQVDYAYNIRGWLTGLNDPYHPNPTKHDLFHLSLHYEQGFSRGYEQYNGNLTGQTWRARDGVQRAYGYVYDPLNRLLQGDYVARAPSAPTPPPAGAWTLEQDRYRLSFVSYDENGNILTLRRRGLLTGGTHATAPQFGAVDELRYTYAGNRLQAVDDAVRGNQLPRPLGYNGAPTSLAGDFQEGSTHEAQEYVYDANGNLTQDRNKGLTGILYNHLNLPRLIHFGIGADSLVFRYTASGQKVAKLVYQTGRPVQRTDYLGPFQYESDSLRFFPHAEGRVLRFVATDGAGQPTVRYEREFSFKDHLGNLRLAYRLGQVRTLRTSLNLDDAAGHGREVQQFDSLSVSAPVAQRVGSGLARTDAFAARLNAGGSAPRPLGPLAQLAVQQGDTVTVTAYGLYTQPVQHNFLFTLGAFLANLLHPAQGAPAGPDPTRGRSGLPLLQVGVAAGLASLPQLGGGVPKGYVRVLVFNRDSALVGQYSQQLSAAALNSYQRLSQRVVVPSDGYVSAYVGNESDVDVLFDDVSVEHRPGVQVQEVEYDPAGLELAGLGTSTPGLKALSQYKFNGKEFQSDLGLNWTQLDWRMFDPQIFTLSVVDPEIENGQESMSPYAFGYDNAVRFNDPSGRCPTCPPTPGAPPDLLNRMVLGIGISIVNLQGQMWAGILGTSTKYAADYVTDANGIAVDYAIHKVPVGTSRQEMTSMVLDELNLLTLALGGGEGKAFEQAGGKVVAAEVVQEAKSTGAITGYTKHGLNQAIGRNGGKGVNAQAISDAVSSPRKVVAQPNGTTKYMGGTGKNATTVVTNSDGKVVTTFGKARGPKVQAEPRPARGGAAPGGGAAQRRAVKETGANYNPRAIR